MMRPIGYDLRPTNYTHGLQGALKSPEILDVAKYPTATYSGTFTQFNGAAPAEAQGTFIQIQVEGSPAG